MQGSTLETVPSGKNDALDALLAAREQLNRIILGKEEKLDLALACLLARGHLLIEDLPGLGKTVLAHSLAKTLGLSFSRIQFTSDLLPADVIGVSVFRKETQEFEFREGPIFSQLVLADEVNRATPKAQSALLEAMEEYQVSTDGRTRRLPQPFFVVATQNPADQIGTFPLPESQLDRFLMRLELGYPSESDERELITGQDRRSMLEALDAVMTPDVLESLQQSVSNVHMSDAIVDYIQALVRQTRETPDVEIGLSPRGAQAIAAASRAYAFIAQHSGVYPDDVQAVFSAVAAHRLKPAGNTNYRNHVELADHILSSVDIP